jgi:RHS repeat-associated protein
MTGSGAVDYMVPDGEGSTRDLVDTSGHIQFRYAFDAYGTLLGATLGVLNQPASRILYTGQQFDPILGQDYLRARYYATTSGRFGQMDQLMGSIVTPLTLNKYVYAANDPTNMADPSGKEFGSLGEILVNIGIRVAMFAVNTARIVASAARAFIAFLRVAVQVMWTGMRLAISAARQGIVWAKDFLSRLITKGLTIKSPTTGGWRFRLFVRTGAPGRPSFTIMSFKNILRIEAHPIRASWPWWVFYPHMHFDAIASIAGWHVGLIETLALAFAVYELAQWLYHAWAGEPVPPDGASDDQ